MKSIQQGIKVLLALGAAGACLPAMAQITISDAWVRATVAGQSTTAAYMVIHSDRDTSLVGAKADIAGRAVVHEMHMHDNMMMMMPVDRLAIGAGHSVSLDPGNYHLMLEDLKRQVKPGEKIHLVLRFVDAKGDKREVAVDAVAREITEQEGHEGHGEHEGHMHDMGH